MRLLNTLGALLTLAGICLVGQAWADLTIQNPIVSGATLDYCSDYFQDELGIRLSMDNAATGMVDDIAYETVDVNSLSYSGGLLSFTTTGSSSYLTLLQYPAVGSIPVGTRYGSIKPVDSSLYQLFTVRMYSSEDTIGRIRWFHDYARWAVVQFPVYAGWHTYQINLATAVVTGSSGANPGYLQGYPQGLEIFPSNETGVSMKIDWIQLSPTSTSCTNYGLAVSGTVVNNDNLYSLLVDTDTDLANGVVVQAATAQTVSGVTTTKNFSADKVYPGTYYVYGIQSGDWASVTQLDPFDMSNAEDIRTSSAYQISGQTFSGGRYIGTTTGTDPGVYIGTRQGKTIDSNVFKYLSIGIDYTLPSGVNDDLLQLIFYNPESTAILGSKYITVTPGYHVYNVLLSGTDGWTGQVGHIRLDPATRSNVSFSLDYIAIRESGYVASLSAPAQFSAAGQLTVNDIRLNMVQPDSRGGRDFAQTQMGNPWNMNSATDVSPIYNVQSAFIYPHNTLIDPSGISHIGDFLYGTNEPGNGDDNYFLVDKNGAIDSSRFVNFCFNGWNKTEQPSLYNSVYRVIWKDPRQGDTNDAYKNGDDVVGLKRAATYCLDLKTGITLEPALPGGSPNPWTSIGESANLINYLRIDLNENTEDASAAYYSLLDWVTLRTDHEAVNQYAVVISAPLNLQVDLYYNTVKSLSGGAYLGTLASGRNTNVKKWDTSAVPDGTYYVYGIASSSGDTVIRYSEGRVRVDHSLTQDTTAPILNCERPYSDYEFDTSLELAGYALDETRLATLEAFIDGAYLTSITPSMFHLAARDAYPNYAEANNPGFQEFQDTSAISSGTHTVRLVATDTGGNEQSCTYSVSRRIGASTTPLTYPEPNGSAVSVPIGVAEGTPVLSVKISKTKVTVRVTGAGNCTSVSIHGATKKDLSDDQVLKRQSGATSISLSANNVPGFVTSRLSSKARKAKVVKDDGIVYLRASCGAGASVAKKLDARKIKTKAKKKKESQILSALKSKLR